MPRVRLSRMAERGGDAPPEAGMACPLSAYDPSARGTLVESQPFLDLG